MELTATYIVSQVFAILMYALLASTYYLKNRKTVLTINILAMVAQAISFICLKAYTGLAMDIVAIIRNIIFMIDEKKNGKSEQNTKKDIMQEVKREFRPEFINRIDEIIVFHKLTDEDVKQIIEIMLNQLQKRMKEQNIELEIDESVKDLIAKKGVDTNYGARPLKRAIQSVLEDRIAEEILDGKIKPNQKAKVLSKEEEVVVE